MLLLLARLAAGQYAGSETCRSCHPSQFAGHSKTGHARSLSRPAQHPLAAAFPKAPGEWAFGAGTQAVTFVSQLDEDHYVEHGLSWYAASKSMALTPGHRTASGERYRTFDPSAAILRCFQCHSTGPLRLTEGFKIEPFETGVQCESCHGPGAAHAKSRTPIGNPKRLSAPGVNDLCGGCHRKPAAAGDDTDWTNPWNTRHQPLYLAQSACFAKSDGALSCFTCHPAHTPMNRGASGYDRTCSACHAKPQHRAVVAGRSCVACHMPVVKPQPDLEFANHWIGVYAEGQPLRPIAWP
ncbi:MAG: cytochrome c3 family protein [Bryobacteraceae bacterium]